jgi:hypothetical protein
MATARGLGSVCTTASALALVTGCGGAGPLLHPAHVLPLGRVSAGVGASGQFVFGEGERSVVRSPVPTNGAVSGSNAERVYLEGAVSRAALAPGVAPWAGARAGLGGSNEGGLTYTGRAARIDARHAFGDDTWALSLGLGASAVLMHPGSNHDLPPPGSTVSAGRFSGRSDDIAATGWGFDVPVLVGWRSSASIVEAWAGVRAGVERVAGDLETNSSVGAEGRASVTAFRKYGGGLVGAAIGLKPFSVALELDVAYQGVSGTATFPASAGVAEGHVDGTLGGVTVAPSGAFIGKF